MFRLLELGVGTGVIGPGDCAGIGIERLQHAVAPAAQRADFEERGDHFLAGDRDEQPAGMELHSAGYHVEVVVRPNEL